MDHGQLANHKEISQEINEAWGKNDVEIKVHEIKTILGFIEEKPLQSASCIMLLLLIGLDKCTGINFMLFLKGKPRMCIN
jgi:hypothetical protein